MTHYHPLSSYWLYTSGYNGQEKRTYMYNGTLHIKDTLGSIRSFLLRFKMFCENMKIYINFICPLYTVEVLMYTYTVHIQIHVHVYWFVSYMYLTTIVHVHVYNWLTTRVWFWNISGAIHPSVPRIPDWAVNEPRPVGSLRQRPKSDMSALTQPVLLTINSTLCGLISLWTERGRIEREGEGIGRGRETEIV